MELTSEDLDDKVAEKGDIIVDCWGTWCGHCEAVATHIERVAEEYEERVAFAKILIDDEPDLIDRFDIRSQPVLLFFKDGELIDRSIGLKSIVELREKILAHYPG